MASYCQAGDTARVTFPDGSILDFTDTPVEITVRREDGIPPQFGTVLAQTDGGGYELLGSFFAPIFDVYYVVQGRSWNLRVSHSAGVTTVGGGSTGGRPFTRVITGWYFNAGGIIRPPKYRVKIINFISSEVFNQLFDSPNYLVECVQGCPQGTLDCGDCCLDCDSINSNLSIIRNTIINL
jgi:hypothetical protein